MVSICTITIKLSALRHLFTCHYIAAFAEELKQSLGSALIAAVRPDPTRPDIAFRRPDSRLREVQIQKVRRRSSDLPEEVPILSIDMTQLGFDQDFLFQEARRRWLKPAEVLSILQNHDKFQITQQPPQKPLSGSVYLFNKRILRFFRKDGHNWRKKKDGRTVGEAHERLKVRNVETLNCYYAHGEQNPYFQRRVYWMLDPAYEHIVLVHYRDINEGKPSPGCTSGVSPCPNSLSSQKLVTSDVYESSSPRSVEVSSDIVKYNGVYNTGEDISLARVEVSEALRRLEHQLSLDDDSLEETIPINSHEGDVNSWDSIEYVIDTFKHEICTDPPLDHIGDGQLHGSYTGTEYFKNGVTSESNSGENRELPSQTLADNFMGENKDYWILESCDVPSGVETLTGLSLEKQACSLMNGVADNQENWLGFNGSISQDWKALSSISDHLAQMSSPIEAGSGLTIAQEQKFTIHEISPEWGYSEESTKVIIVGSFLCDPSESDWVCMFGDTEVPIQIIQDGVLRCEAPPHVPGRVTLCISSGNRESSSEIRQFDYQAKATTCVHSSSLFSETEKSTEELLLLVRFVQMLLSDKSLQQKDNYESKFNALKTDEDSWSHVIEALSLGSGTSIGTIDWLLQVLIKEKLQRRLALGSKEEPFYPLSKNEQGIIHIVAGLGFEWALTPILSRGVCIDFRDSNGWTALHWAAHFGREKMVAALIAHGASPGAVTDPTPQDPTGKTPAVIAASSGYKGLAGYLSELALTSHLSSLKLEESELSKASAEVEADRTVSSISNETLAANEDHDSLKDTLAAVRNASLAAARIQNAFRVHSFRKRREREAAAASVDTEYGITPADIQGLFPFSVGTVGSAAFHSAALAIQKKYRGWKGRRDFLALRQKVVKIQAHVRGYQARKHYKVICWAVSMLEKVILRWRRKGIGLRGFHQDDEFSDADDYEDILKVFRKQKVDAALEGAVSRVLSMVNSPEAREQYCRMLERYRQAKAEVVDISGASNSTSPGNSSNMEV